MDQPGERDIYEHLFTTLPSKMASFPSLLSILIPFLFSAKKPNILAPVFTPNWLFNLQDLNSYRFWKLRTFLLFFIAIGNWLLFRLLLSIYSVTMIRLVEYLLCDYCGFTTCALESCIKAIKKQILNGWQVNFWFGAFFFLLERSTKKKLLSTEKGQRVHPLVLVIHIIKHMLYINT